MLGRIGVYQSLWYGWEGKGEYEMKISKNMKGSWGCV